MSVVVSLNFFDLTKSEEDRASTLHEKFIVLNALDVSFARNWDDRCVDSQIEAGLTANVVCASMRHQDFGGTLRALCEWRNLIAKSRKMLLATGTNDIVTAKKQRKLAVVLFMDRYQPTKSIEAVYLEYMKEMENGLEVLQSLGLRVSQLAYWRRNIVADGCGERTDSGLSEFGIKVVKEFNRIGLVIDTSHLGPKSISETAEYSEDPVIFSHGGSYSLCENIRNIRDNQIKAVAEKGGVVGIVGGSVLLKKEGAKRGASVVDFMDHVDYVTKLVGVDHVGIGLDRCAPEIKSPQEAVAYFERMKGCFPTGYPEGSTRARAWSIDGIGVPEFDAVGSSLNPYAKLVNITRGLVSRGYSDQEVEKVLGGNFLRVFKKVWGT